MNVVSIVRTPAQCRALIERRLASRAADVLRRLTEPTPWFPRLDLLPEDSARVLAAYDRRCVYCVAEPGDVLVTDHLVPADRGGTNQVENLVAACERCKGDRRGRHLDRFLARRMDLDGRGVYARIARATAVLRAAATTDRGAV